LNHPGSSSILAWSAGELLEQLGSSEPTPGGGAAAAVAGALGAALVQMTANLTVGRRRFAEIEDQARRIAQRAATLRERLALLADADAEAFERVSAAYKLPRADDVQKNARLEAIQLALVSAAEVPLETARLCAEVLAAADEAAPILNPAVISDVMVGGLLAEAALRSAAVNVEINLANMTSTVAIERLSRELDNARSGIDERLARILATGRSRFPGRNV
jgi:formiminotetrahydrofolate cyclodeaminase